MPRGQYDRSKMKKHASDDAGATHQKRKYTKRSDISSSKPTVAEWSFNNDQSIQYLDALTRARAVIASSDIGNQALVSRIDNQIGFILTKFQAYFVADSSEQEAKPMQSPQSTQSTERVTPTMASPVPFNPTTTASGFVQG